jgi:flagellar motor switch protein FliG
MSQTPDSQLSGVRKAAILMVLLGDETASAVCKRLPEPQLRAVTQEIAGLDSISPEIALRVLQEYQRLSGIAADTAYGGRNFAGKLLLRTFGEEGARPRVQEWIGEQEKQARIVEQLNSANPEHLAKFVQDEQPQTVALLLAQLKPKTCRSLLSLLPERIRCLAVKRLAQLKELSPVMLGHVSATLQSKLSRLGGQGGAGFEGPKVAAELLNQIGQESTKQILEAIELEDSNLAGTLRNLMFTFGDFIEVQETGMRELLGQVDKKTLAISLKGAAESLKNHFFKCMSSRAVEMLKEDMDSLGPLRSKEVITAQKDIIAVARQLESEGKIVLTAEVEESYVV